MLHIDEVTQALIEGTAWVISDTHFYHKNIGVYCNRPDDWHNLIITNWNTYIKNEDIVFHLGDFALTSKSKLQELIPLLNGRIMLLRGNHDKFSKAFYNEQGITLREHPLYINLNPEKRWVFSHRPLDILSGYYNFHGHIHDLESSSPYHINLSVEMTEYKPVKMSELIFALS